MHTFCKIHVLLRNEIYVLLSKRFSIICIIQFGICLLRFINPYYFILLRTNIQYKIINKLYLYRQKIQNVRYFLRKNCHPEKIVNQWIIMFILYDFDLFGIDQLREIFPSIKNQCNKTLQIDNRKSYLILLIDNY